MNLANKITVSKIVLIPLFFLCLQAYTDWMLVAAIGIFVLAAATDKLDGYIARKYNMVTNLGKLLDPLADKLLISVALIVMVEQSLIPAWTAIVIIGREIIITAIRVVASAQKIALAADQLGKIKLVIQVVAIAVVLLNHLLQDTVHIVGLDVYLMWLAVAITMYSGFHYISNNYKRLGLQN